MKRTVEIPEELAQFFLNLKPYTLMADVRAAVENLCEILAKPAEQHRGEPVALQWRKFIRGENEPEPGVEVLVRYARQWPNDKVFFITGGMLNKAFEDIDTLFWINGTGECMGGTVSHWMPMPNPDDALSASAEPSAPVEIDERAAFESRYKVGLGRDSLSNVYYSGATQWRWEGWQARSALERKP